MASFFQSFGQVFSFYLGRTGHHANPGHRYQRQAGQRCGVVTPFSLLYRSTDSTMLKIALCGLSSEWNAVENASPGRSHHVPLPCTAISSCSQCRG